MAMGRAAAAATPAPRGMGGAALTPRGTPAGGGTGVAGPAAPRVLGTGGAGAAERADRAAVLQRTLAQTNAAAGKGRKRKAETGAAILVRGMQDSMGSMQKAMGSDPGLAQMVAVMERGIASFASVAEPSPERRRHAAAEKQMGQISRNVSTHLHNRKLLVVEATESQPNTEHIEHIDAMIKLLREREVKLMKSLQSP
jgi:hypothetical protein